MTDDLLVDLVNALGEISALLGLMFGVWLVFKISGLLWAAFGGVFGDR